MPSDREKFTVPEGRQPPYRGYDVGVDPNVCANLSGLVQDGVKGVVLDGDRVFTDASGGSSMVGEERFVGLSDPKSFPENPPKGLVRRDDWSTDQRIDREFLLRLDDSRYKNRREFFAYVEALLRRYGPGADSELTSERRHMETLKFALDRREEFSIKHAIYAMDAIAVRNLAPERQARIINDLYALILKKMRALKITEEIAHIDLSSDEIRPLGFGIKWHTTGDDERHLDHEQMQTLRIRMAWWTRVSEEVDSRILKMLNSTFVVKGKKEIAGVTSDLDEKDLRIAFWSTTSRGASPSLAYAMRCELRGEGEELTEAEQEAELTIESLGFLEIPETFSRCTVIMLSPTVWEDHMAAREGVDPGVAISVSREGESQAQRLTIMPLGTRYNRAAFIELLRKIKREALECEISFE